MAKVDCCVGGSVAAHTTKAIGVELLGKGAELVVLEVAGENLPKGRTTIVAHETDGQGEAVEHDGGGRRV